jgi:hypothetical protein
VEKIQIQSVVLDLLIWYLMIKYPGIDLLSTELGINKKHCSQQVAMLFILSLIIFINPIMFFFFLPVGLLQCIVFIGIIKEGIIGVF